MKSLKGIKYWGGAVLVLALALTLLAPPAQAKDDQFRYRYVSLAAIELPPGISFVDFTSGVITNSGRIYGEAYDEINFFPHIAAYAQGVLTVFQYPQPTFVYAVNEEGTVGGSVVTDTVNFYQQAALFRGDHVELIPRLPGEITSWVTALNDPGMALVLSFDVSSQRTVVLYDHGKLTPLDFGPNITDSFFLHINNQGIISGTTFQSLTSQFRGFRFDYRTGKTTLLDPLPTEPNSWALGINNRGDVLGYSFISGGLERIGVWDKKEEFNTYFVEGTPEFPTVSNSLLFNDNNLIVITNTTDNTSYLVPKPGVRLNLADLVENLPSGQNVAYILDMNNPGNMIGFSAINFNITDMFLLERIGQGAPIEAPVPDYGGERHREVMEKANKARELRKSSHPWLNEERQK